MSWSVSVAWPGSPTALLMWIPAGGIYLAVALALLVSWIRATEVDDVAVEEAGRHGGGEARPGPVDCRPPAASR